MSRGRDTRMPERQTSSGTVGSSVAELDEATADGSAVAPTAPTERPADVQQPPAAPSPVAEAPTAPARAAHDGPRPSPAPPSPAPPSPVNPAGAPPEEPVAADVRAAA